ncbi:TlpA family protein disulfide reductase [Hydrogenophaga taeniospiralis]|uniref:TlpA family protein disulfide reductase n=1 Tax=Hydrogenophaga taeniospiralis TaxID=65656 RepID=UPI001CFAE043|nr:TlpA disulfide reductase family protein [Hydrogenophaga taeniospiralis]MCB4365930.1 TlpA family protein disulfide reductase [Hydrogenophaga taeniospiralis]
MRHGLTRRGLLGASLGLWAGALPATALHAADTATGQRPGYQLSDWPAQRPTPALDAQNLQGERVRLADFQGRVVLLNFWATWCPPCRAEMPTLQAVPEWLGEDKVVVLALNHREAGRTARRFLAASGLTLPVLLDPQGDITQAWGVRAFPTTVLIDANGRARQVVQGEVDWSSPTALGWVERLLAQR